jgi:hypothetical protein
MKFLFPPSLLLCFLLLTTNGSSQDLLSLVQDDKTTIDYTSATFKTTRIVIGQSIENPAKGNMLFLIGHHFGALNTGYENLFGLKQANIRLGLEYGINDRMGIGVGLNTYKNTWDGFLKIKVLRQSTGAKKMPLTVDLYANTAIYTTKWTIPERTNYFTSRMSYCFEVLIARKFGQRLSLQLTPGFVHKNFTPSYEDKNDQFTIGAGGRFKVSKRVSINAEYYYLIPNRWVSEDLTNSFSVGVDIETGGHVFQVFLTNSDGLFDEAILAETTGKWANGVIFLGFNISRIFTIVKPKVN